MSTLTAILNVDRILKELESESLENLIGQINIASAYKPNLKKLFCDNDAHYFIEKHNSKINNECDWFRIFRVKNTRRTHDFIINKFTFNEVIVDSDSKDASLIFQSKTHLIKLFLLLNKTNSFYNEYTRLKSNEYVGKAESLLIDESLYELFSHL